MHCYYILFVWTCVLPVVSLRDGKKCSPELCSPVIQSGTTQSLCGFFSSSSNRFVCLPLPKPGVAMGAVRVLGCGHLAPGSENVLINEVARDQRIRKGRG